MPLPPDVVPLVREFASNGFRYLFRQGDNVADLLRWREPKIARGIDFTRLAVQPETFLAPSFAQLESDILLRAPFRIRHGKDGRIEIFILIEHLWFIMTERTPNISRWRSSSAPRCARPTSRR